MTVSAWPTTLPTRKQQDRVARKLSDGTEAVSSLVRQLQHLDGDETKVTAADIGELWSFSDGVRLDIHSLRRDLKEFRRQLGRLDSARLDSKVGAEA